MRIKSVQPDVPPTLYAYTCDIQYQEILLGAKIDTTLGVLYETDNKCLNNLFHINCLSYSPLRCPLVPIQAYEKDIKLKGSAHSFLV